MLRFTHGKCLLPALVLAICVATLALEAKPRRLSDLGDRSNVQTMRFAPPMKDIKTHDSMQARRVEFGQWHGTFSSIGEKRSGISTSDQFASQMMNYPQVEHRSAGIAVEAGMRQMAPLRNMDQVRDIVIASHFDKMSPRTVEGRALQEMVDEMSLKDINRFQAHRNKTDVGIPVQTAGSEAAPVVDPATQASDD